jgi:hypothetical protein
LQVQHDQATTAASSYESFCLLFAGIGTLAFLISAISPQDDKVQQEPFRNRALFNLQNEITAGASVPQTTTNTSYATAFITQHPAQPDAVVGALFVAAACLPAGRHGNQPSSRAPPRSI